MANGKLKIWLIIVNLLFFGLNFSPVLAQVMEIEVIGGGYRLRGPDMIQFSSLSASLAVQESILDIRTLDAQNEEAAASTHALDYLAIEDQNGGTIFDVTVSATVFQDSTNLLTISNGNLFVKNKNGAGSDIVVDNESSNLNGVSLNPDTDAFAPLDIQRTLFSGEGLQPGAWRIFPVFRLNVPAETVPGTYLSTLTFTII
jgi:hypothetical protein